MVKSRLLAGLLVPGQAITYQEILDVIAAGPYSDDFDVMEKLYKPPQWYLDGKFGFYTHWGVYSVPGFGNEWYPRNMYKEGQKDHEHQVETYGALSVSNGYKEFIPNFTGEHFNATEWMDVFRRAGAKYAGPVGEHHDGFAMYNCSISEYNALNMGPKRDVTAELKAAADALPDMHFVVSSHRAWHSAFYNGGRKIPESDVAQCTCDGGGAKAKDDADFCTLYCPANPNEKTPTEGFMKDWLLRTCEIIDKYSNDVMYFDWWIGVSKDWQPWVKKMAAFYYNKMVAAGKMGVINTKGTTMRTGTDVLDFERGQACTIQKHIWQTDTSISRKSWGFIEGDSYKSGQSMIGNLVDIVAKNGALMMNVGPAPNGTIPQAAVDSFLEIGDWLQEAGDSIYGSRPYHLFAEGPTIMGCGSFSSEEVDFSVKDFRFTSKGDTVFALAMGAKGGDSIVVEALGTALAAEGDITSVSVLGHGEVPFKVDAAGLHVTLPAAAGNLGPPVLAAKGLTDTQWDGRVRQSKDGAYRLTATNTMHMGGGAKLNSKKNCQGALEGGCSVIDGLDGKSASATWSTKSRAAGQTTLQVVASSPNVTGTVTMQLQDGKSVSVQVPSTGANEFKMASGTTPLQISKDENVSITATAGVEVASVTLLASRTLLV